MNDQAPPTRIEQINQLVRSFVTILLSLGFVWGFYTEKIGAEAFVSIFGTILGFWFGSREAKSRSTDVTTPSTPVGAAAAAEAPAR